MPPIAGAAVTVGSFDGVHAAHRALLTRLGQMARSAGGQTVVVTFDPHPRNAISDGVEELSPAGEKAWLLERAGVDNLVIIPFTEQFRSLSSADFVRDVLVGKIGMKSLLVGYNHHFGRDKEGNFDALSQLSRELNFDVEQLPRQEVGSSKVSSTVVRELISRGQMAQTSELLGYPYFVFVHQTADGLRPLYSTKLLPPPGDYPVVVDNHEDILTISPNKGLTLSSQGKLSSENPIIVFAV